MSDTGVVADEHVDGVLLALICVVVLPTWTRSVRRH